MLRIPLPEYADGPLTLPVEILRTTPANVPSRKAQGQKGQRDGRVMGHTGHIGHMRPHAPSQGTPASQEARLICLGRSKPRFLCVFAVKPSWQYKSEVCRIHAWRE